MNGLGPTGHLVPLIVIGLDVNTLSYLFLSLNNIKVRQPKTISDINIPNKIENVKLSKLEYKLIAFK